MRINQSPVNEDKISGEMRLKYLQMLNILPDHKVKMLIKDGGAVVDGKAVAVSCHKKPTVIIVDQLNTPLGQIPYAMINLNDVEQLTFQID
ncbi:hypothetical protein GJ496_005338 [Pomphorhynchus laevis]|nr:hypothetical protein GJ496_005338 [Pomphorhynchus laevis]